MQRANLRQTVFFCDADYSADPSLIARSCERAGTSILSYCLMPNHIDLILVPGGEGGLRGAIPNRTGTTRDGVNFREAWRGHLWQERFHSFVMDDAHLAAAIPYVERTLVRAKPGQSTEQWAWSCARSRLADEENPLVGRGVLAGLLPSTIASGEQLAQRVPKAIHQDTRTGRPIGGDGFVDRLEALTGQQLNPHRPGPKPRKGSDTLIDHLN